MCSITYLVIAVYVIVSQPEWWGQILMTITLPAGIVFAFIGESLSGAVLHENPADNAIWVSNVNHAFQVFTFVVGGMIWFYLISIAAQWMCVRLWRIAFMRVRPAHSGYMAGKRTASDAPARTQTEQAAPSDGDKPSN